MGETNTEYGADQIQILEGLEAVRKRPGMYIGSTSSRGLHHLVYEIVDNAVDEALAGYCTEINVAINPDNSITVVDNGRGIPVGINHKAGIPAVEVVFTILHAGGKFGGGGYKVSGGLHGVGASVVNALSEWLEVSICRDGKRYEQRYERGKTMYPLKEVGECGDSTGTTVTFLPDKQIFEETVYDYDILKQRLREMAFLTKGLKIILTDKREGMEREKTFHYEGGIREFVTYLNRSKEALYPERMPESRCILHCEKKNEGFKTSSKVQFAAKAGNFIDAGEEYNGALQILKVIMSYEYLWLNIRVKGGAYGCMSNFNRIGEGYFVSYRDPNLGRTLEIYDGVPEYLENFTVSERDMTKYIIGTISNIDQPMTPATKGDRSMNLYMNHVSAEMIRKEREQILTANQEDIRALAGVARAVLANDQICVIGNEAKIEEEKELFMTVENLF